MAIWVVLMFSFGFYCGFGNEVSDSTTSFTASSSSRQDGGGDLLLLPGSSITGGFGWCGIFLLELIQQPILIKIGILLTVIKVMS